MGIQHGEYYLGLSSDKGNSTWWANIASMGISTWGLLGLVYRKGKVERCVDVKELKTGNNVATRIGTGLPATYRKDNSQISSHQQFQHCLSLAKTQERFKQYQHRRGHKYGNTVSEQTQGPVGNQIHFSELDSKHVDKSSQNKTQEDIDGHVQVLEIEENKEFNPCATETADQLPDQHLANVIYKATELPEQLLSNIIKKATELSDQRLSNVIEKAIELPEKHVDRDGKMNECVITATASCADQVSDPVLQPSPDDSSIPFDQTGSSSMTGRKCYIWTVEDTCVIREFDAMDMSATRKYRSKEERVYDILDSVKSTMFISSITD